MDWTSYFVALGLPIILNSITLLLAITFIQSEFIKRLFLYSLVAGLIAEVFGVLLGLMAALIQVFGD